MLTSSVINQTSLRLWQGEHCPQPYWTWRGKKKKRAPKSVCYRFYRETETDYAPTLCIQLRISRELHVGRFKKRSLKVFALIFGAFFLVIIQFRVTRQSCVPTKGSMIAQRRHLTNSRADMNCSLSVKSMKFGVMIVFKALKKIGYGAIAEKSVKCEK